jgi:hypothetical protein
VLTTAGYPEGLPCSPLVAQVIALLDGQTAIATVLERFCVGHSPEQAAPIATHVLAALQLLYVDGTIAELSGL